MSAIETERHANVCQAFGTVPPSVTPADLDAMAAEVAAAGVKPELRHLSTLPQDQFAHEYKTRMEKLVGKYNQITRSNARVVMDGSAPCGYHLLHGTPAPPTAGIAPAYASGDHSLVSNGGATPKDAQQAKAAAAANFWGTPPELSGFGGAKAHHDNSFN